MAHLQKVEEELIWLRRIALIGIGIALYLLGHDIELNTVWLIYLGGVIYMIALHWLVQSPVNIQYTAWVITISDPLLIFFICLVTGGFESIFKSFLYFTVISANFRFEFKQSVSILFFITLLVILLVFLPANQEINVSDVFLTLFFLGFSAGMGRLMASWARANLKVALAQTSALRTERDRSRSLLHKLINAQEVEREQFAGDLHDRMGARLFSLQHGLDNCLRLSGDDPDLKDQLSDLRKEIAECSTDVRLLMNELRPTVLDELGFYEAVSEYVANIKGFVPFSIESRLDPKLKNWQSKQDAMLFRLIQEALLNVRKHAQANNVIIGGERLGDGVTFYIEDDGRGFDPAQIPSGHYGILTMRERAEAAGGELSIESRPGSGTRITITFNVSSQ